MKKETRKTNATDYISDNYSNLILIDNHILKDKEFEFLVNVFLKKIRRKKPPNPQVFFCEVCKERCNCERELHYQTCQAINYI